MKGRIGDTLSEVTPFPSVIYGVLKKLWAKLNFYTNFCGSNKQDLTKVLKKK